MTNHLIEVFTNELRYQPIWTADIAGVHHTRLGTDFGNVHMKDGRVYFFGRSGEAEWVTKELRPDTPHNSDSGN